MKLKLGMHHLTKEWEFGRTPTKARRSFCLRYVHIEPLRHRIEPSQPNKRRQNQKRRFSLRFIQRGVRIPSWNMGLLLPFYKEGTKKAGFLYYFLFLSIFIACFVRNGETRTNCMTIGTRTMLPFFPIFPVLFPFFQYVFISFDELTIFIESNQQAIYSAKRILKCKDQYITHDQREQQLWENRYLSFISTTVVIIVEQRLQNDNQIIIFFQTKRYSYLGIRPSAYTVYILSFAVAFSVVVIFRWELR